MESLSFDQAMGKADSGPQQQPGGDGIAFADAVKPAEPIKAPEQVTEQSVIQNRALAMAETMSAWGKQHAFDVGSEAATKPEPHGFLANLKSPRENLREDNIWKELFDIHADMKDARDYIHLSGPHTKSMYEQELERRKKLNPNNSYDNPYLPHWDMMAMAQWEHQESNRLIKQWHSQGKPPSLTFHQMVGAVAKDPGRFAAEALNSMMSHPELLLFPVGESSTIEKAATAAFVKMARVTPRIAAALGRMTSAGIAGAMIAAPSSAIQQSAEKGTVDPKSFIRDVGIGAFTTGVFSASIKLAAGVKAKAMGGNVRKIADEMDKMFEEKIKSGRDPMQALDDVMTEMKVIGGKDISAAAKKQIEAMKARANGQEGEEETAMGRLQHHAKHQVKHAVQHTEKEILSAHQEKKPPAAAGEEPKKPFFERKAVEIGQEEVQNTQSRMLDAEEPPVHPLAPRVDISPEPPVRPHPWEYNPHEQPDLLQRHEMLKQASPEVRQQLIKQFQEEDRLRQEGQSRYNETQSKPQQSSQVDQQEKPAVAENLQRADDAQQANPDGNPPTKDQVRPLEPEVEMEMTPEERAIPTGTREAGSIDPKLLAVLGLSGAGAAAAYALTEDPKVAMATALAVGGIAAGAKVAGRFVDAASKMYAEHLLDTRYMPTDLFRGYYGDIRSSELAIRRLSNALETMVPREIDREMVTHYLQGEKVDPHGAEVKLNPEQKALADAIQKSFKNIGELAQKEGVIEDLRQNYVTGLWRRGVKSGDPLYKQIMAAAATHYSPGMSPRSRFGLEKSIPSYVQGIKDGFVPVTMDPVQILQKYSFNVTKAIANKKLIDAIKTHAMPDGKRMVVSQIEGARLREAAKDARELARRFMGTDQEHQYTEAAMVATAKVRALEDYDYLKGNLQLKDYLVHKDVLTPLRFVFDSGTDLELVRAMHALSMVQKQGIFSFSMFHAKSLMDAAIGASYVAGPVGIAAGAATYAATGGDPEKTALVAGLTAMFVAGRQARAGYLMFRDGKAGDLVEHLVRNGLVLEKPIDTDQQMLSILMKQVSSEIEKTGAKVPIVGKPAAYTAAKAVDGARKIAEVHNYFLWDVLQPGLKTNLAASMYTKMLNKNLAAHAKDPTVPLRDINEMAREATQFTNDIFGGLDWFELANGVKTRGLRTLAFGMSRRSGRQVQQILMLAPDWTVATARTWLKALPGMSKPEVMMHYWRYLTTAGMMYAIVADGLNMHFTGHHFWENKDPTTVELGDGTRMNLSKHFMEGLHWIMKPDQQALNKLGGVPKEFAEQFLNKEYLSVHGAPEIVTPVPRQAQMQERQTGRPPNLTQTLGMYARNTAQRIGHAASIPVPITAKVIAQQGIKPAASGYLGMPVYGKTEEQYVNEAVSRAARQGRDVERAALLARKRWERTQRTNQQNLTQP